MGTGEGNRDGDQVQEVPAGLCSAMSQGLFCPQALAVNSVSVHCVTVALTGLPQGALLPATTCPASGQEHRNTVPLDTCALK